MAWCDVPRGYVHPGETVRIIQADPGTSYYIRVQETRKYFELSAHDKRTWPEDVYGREDFIIGHWLAKVGDVDGHAAGLARTTGAFLRCHDVNEFVLRRDRAVWPAVDVLSVVVVWPAAVYQRAPFELTGVLDAGVMHSREVRNGRLEPIPPEDVRGAFPEVIGCSAKDCIDLTLRVATAPRARAWRSCCVHHDR